MEYCSHAWTGVPSCYLDMLDKLQKLVCETVGSTFATSLEPLGHHKNVASLSFFYMCCFGKYSSLVDFSCYSNRLHDFSVTIPSF